ncbi:DNA-binding protein HU [Candidatus Campbellbacteria bacterium]|nr:MAG: DNA-binding protein HU [Candidatus Campbellbacteria bacterium]
MNKGQLVEFIADKVGSTKADAERMLEAFMEAVTETLKKEDSVALTGFGAFSISHRKARTARNPKTGAEVKVPATKAPKFKAGKKLKEAVK